MDLTRIDILSHADYHGQFREDDSTVGLSRFYCAIEEIRKINPDCTLLLDAGDESKCLWHGKDVYDGLKLLKTDAMTIGNHEFDAGKEDLEQCIKYATENFPVVCANAVYKDSKELINNVKPYVILEKSGIKFGVIGLTTEYTPYMVEKSAFEPFSIIDSVTEIRKYVPQMREEGADIIICLTHFPFYFKDGEAGELFEVFEKVKDLNIDVFIGGHIPGDYGKIYQDCAIVKGGFGGDSLPHITLYFDKQQHKIIKKEVEVINVEQCRKHNQVIDEFVKKVIKPYNYYFDEVLAVAKEDIPMRLSCESPMGNLVADGIRDAVNTDFAYFNTTSCGRMLPKGNVTRYSIQKILAFNETIQVSTITGKQIWQLFELVHYPEIFGNNANIMFSGLIVKINHTKEKDHKVISITDYNGNSIDFEKEYSVCTSKYISSGGNDTKKVSCQLRWSDSGIKIHDALAMYFKKMGEINCPQLGRYPFIGTPENDNSPW